MTKSTASDSDGLGRAGVLLASGTIVSRILGFVAAILLARTLGTIGSGADAFALANQIPNNIYALVAGGILTAVLVPHIVRAEADEDRGAGYVNKIVTFGFVIFFAIGALATLAAPLLVSLYAQQADEGGRGFTSADMALATGLAYWALPQVLFYALYSLVGEVLNARKVFGPFTWAPVLNNLVFIAGLLVFGQLFGSRDASDASEWTPDMVALLGGGATLGIAAQALILFLFWRFAGLRYRPDFRWRGVGLARTGKAAGWLFGMILLTQIAGVVQASIATLATSDGQPGLAVLRFSWLLFMVPHSVITVSLATAYFTRMATHARDGDSRAIISDVNQSLRHIGAMMVLASAGLFVLSIPFATVFGGSPEAITGMAAVIAAFSLGLLAFSLVFVVQRVFYSLDDTKTPFIFQIVHTTLFIGLAVTSSALASAELAVGLAISSSIASVGQLVFALWLLKRRLPGFAPLPVVRRLGVFVLAVAPALVVGVVLVLGTGGLDPAGFIRSNVWAAAGAIGIVGTVMTLIYWGVLWLVGNDDIRAITGGIGRLVRRVFTGRE